MGRNIFNNLIFIIFILTAFLCVIHSQEFTKGKSSLFIPENKIKPKIFLYDKLPEFLQKEYDEEVSHLKSLIYQFSKSESFGKKKYHLQKIIEIMQTTNKPHRNWNLTDMHFYKKNLLKTIFTDLHQPSSTASQQLIKIYRPNGELEPVVLSQENPREMFPDHSEVLLKLLTQPKDIIPELSNLFIQAYIHDIDDDNENEIVEKPHDLVRKGYGDCSDVMMFYSYLFSLAGINQFLSFAYTIEGKPVGHAGVIYFLENQYYFIDQYNILHLGRELTEPLLREKLTSVNSAPSEKNSITLHIYDPDDIYSGKKIFPRKIQNLSDIQNLKILVLNP